MDCQGVELSERTLDGITACIKADVTTCEGADQFVKERRLDYSVSWHQDKNIPTFREQSAVNGNLKATNCSMRVLYNYAWL